MAGNDPTNGANAIPVWIAPAPTGATGTTPATASLVNIGASVSGSVATGASQVSFYNSSTVVVTVAGGNLNVGASVNFNAPQGGVLGPIAYTTPALGALQISSVR